MRKPIIIAIAIWLLMAIACKKETENYSFIRPSKASNFKSKSGGELYAFTAKDSLTERADYYIRVKGRIKSYGSRVIKYGHCWSENKQSPMLGSDFDTLVNCNPHIAPGELLDTLGYICHLPRLKPATSYFVRSVIITGTADGIPLDTGYNQTVSKFTTLPAIDEWFELDNFKPNQAARFDALVFNYGDTIFFGTGNQGNTRLLKDIVMYNPETDQWDPDFVRPLSTTRNSGSSLPANLTNGIGFAIEYKRDAANKVTRSIFVGLGDHNGNDIRTEKSDRLLEYDLSDDPGEGHWVETGVGLTSRSDAVCFVLNGHAYVGTGVGEKGNPVPFWNVFDPAKGTWTNFDGDDLPSKDVGRSGAVAFSLNGRGYFGLGTDGKGNFFGDFWVYKPHHMDPIGGGWSKIDSFPGKPRANAVAFVIGDQAFVGTGDNYTVDMEKVPYAPSNGEIFNDFYRYDPYTDTWDTIRPYTADKGRYNREGAIRPVTRAIGFAIQSKNAGYVGYGIEPVGYTIPDPPKFTSTSYAQKDLWIYQPYELGKK